MYSALMVVSLIAPASVWQAPAIASVRISPAKPVIVAHDTMRIRAEALDASGQPVRDVKIRFVTAGFANAGQIDSMGLVSTASPGVLPVVAIASPAGGGRPTTERLEIKIVVGQPATIQLIAPPGRIVVGQQVKLGAIPRTAYGD